MTVLLLAEQIAVRGRHDRRGRLQESVVELVAEKSNIAHLQAWKGFVRNGHERAAWQRRLAHAATRRRKGEFIQVRSGELEQTCFVSFGSRGNKFRSVWRQFRANICFNIQFSFYLLALFVYFSFFFLHNARATQRSGNATGKAAGQIERISDRYG